MQNLKSKFKIIISSKTFYFLLVLLIFEFLFLNLDKAEASALSLSLDPPIIEIHALPPAAITSSLNIQNKGDMQATLLIQLKPFQAKGENSFLSKNVQILDNGVPVEAVTLAPSQQKTLALKITIPPDTNTSDYYFSVVFISQNPAETEQANSNSVSAVSLSQLGIASNVLVSVGAKENPNATIEEFSSDLFFQKGPVAFTVRVNNLGNQFIKPKGNIVIQNMFGQSIGKLDLASVNILSNSIRAIPNTLWKENFLLGFYTATLNLSLSNNGPTFTKSIRFFAFPLQGAIILVIILIILNTLRIKLKRHLKH